MNTSTYQKLDSNPYATPRSEVISPTHDDTIKYDGKLLSVTHPVVLPKLCIKCGEACNEKQKTKKLTWANPLWAISFLIIGIFYFLIHLIVSKKLTVSYSLCPEHKAKEKKKSIILWSVAIFSILLMSSGNMFDVQEQYIKSGLLFAGLIIFLILILTALLLPRVIIIKKIKRSKNVTSERPYVFFLGGIDQSFVDNTKIDQRYPT